MKTIALVSDHEGYELKQLIAAHLRTRGYTVNDFGTIRINEDGEPCR
jgi:ribose 5-phosphate isomerase RpiB